MQGISQVIQSLGLKGIFHSDQCMLHKRPITKVILQGQVICPVCEREKGVKDDQLIYDQENDRYKRVDREKKHNMLLRHSLLENKSITESRLQDYRTECSETAQNKQLVQDITRRIIAGEVLNVFLVGVQGTGKSHLAYSILHELNEHYYELSDGEKYGDDKLYDTMKSCLFVETETLMRVIRDSFRNKESELTEDYCVRLMVDADFLCIDDLGAESGSMNRVDDEASNFVQRVLYAVANGRQDKTTITTTNLSSQAIFQKYDKKLGSRLLRNAVPVVFKETSDKRIAHLGF